MLYFHPQMRYRECKYNLEEETMKRAAGIFYLFLSFLLVLSNSYLCPLSAQAYETEELKIAALEKVEVAYQEIADQEYALQIAVDQLPEQLRPLLEKLIEAATLDVPAEQKLSMLINASGSDCSIYALVWLAGLLISFVPYIGSVGGALQAIGIMGLILCLLGVI